MQEQDLPDLQKENATLRKIVNVLLEQNEAKQQQIHLLQQQIETNRATHSPLQQQDDTKQTAHSLPQLPLEPSQLLHSLTQTKIESKQATDSLSQLPVASSQATHSLSQTEIEAKQLTQPNSDLSSGMKHEAEPLPLKLAEDKHNFQNLAVHLHASGFGGYKMETCRVAARLLVCFYNNETASYKQLKRLTSYSDGGLGKLMMNLRRKGLLIKSGFQKHCVTGKACKLMQEAGCK